RRHTRSYGDWSSDVCSSDLYTESGAGFRGVLDGYFGAVGGSAAHAGAAAARHEAGSVSGSLPGECGAPGALTWRRPDLHEPRPRSEERRVGKECRAEWEQDT